jgi:hypothetical protein
MKPRHRLLSDAQLIRLIVARALAAPLAVQLSRVALRAEIAAAHARRPIGLRALLNAGDLVFFDRVLGIHRAAAHAAAAAGEKDAA